MRKPHFIIGIVCLALGALLGNLILQRPATQLDGHEAQSELKEKLQTLTDNDITEYYRLKNLEDKYKKADEILGKIVTLFLADLGIRVSKTTLKMASKSIAAATAE